MPYITRWSEERSLDALVVPRHGGGIGYADEQVHDRDGNGILWGRVSHRPGKGRPEFGKVHGPRQRRAMRRALCQICAGPADRNRQGVLWLLGEDGNDPETWPTDVLTCHPPVCLPCATKSVGACPHLREGYVALRVRRFAPAGVRGVLYRPALPLPVMSEAVGVALDDPMVRWVRAGQLIVRLAAFSVVDLAEAAAQRG
ncbi:hypothetical protein RM780_20260 [Streptomyces sp. DSM 44917]|uniref:Phage protein n=1 Tax=Streptomyces boetiae TaxID=3075541 RepID=A0ABU2LCH1_9ACTN|nr:hypothetical protein [Streptomyces sp. DSM 44917]MDT0309276.1 hypothetical protein [Streptomyces sp. DSM 44917]